MADAVVADSPFAGMSDSQRSALVSMLPLKTGPLQRGSSLSKELIRGFSYDPSHSRVWGDLGTNPAPSASADVLATEPVASPEYWFPELLERP